jgi:hypothetical protein
VVWPLCPRWRLALLSFLARLRLALLSLLALLRWALLRRGLLALVGLTQYHLISYWVRTFPNHFELVPTTGAERFPVRIGFARIIDPPRPHALKAFDEFFFSRAKDIYPRYHFA